MHSESIHFRTLLSSWLAGWINGWTVLFFKRVNIWKTESRQQKASFSANKWCDMGLSGWWKINPLLRDCVCIRVNIGYTNLPIRGLCWSHQNSIQTMQLFQCEVNKCRTISMQVSTTTYLMNPLLLIANEIKCIENHLSSSISFLLLYFPYPEFRMRSYKKSWMDKTKYKMKPIIILAQSFKYEFIVHCQ